MNFEKISFGAIATKLSRTEMKKIMAGSGEESGQCVLCTCHSGGSSCWYTRRGASALCSDVCGGPYFNALEGIGCGGCTMN